MNKSSLRGMLLLSLLAGTVLACSISVGGPKLLPASTAVSPVPTQNLQPQVETAVPTSPAAGEVQIRLTDAQMTAFMVNQMKQQQDPILLNPQVHAHDSVIDVYGTVQRSLFSGNVRVTLVPSVDDQGTPHLKVQSADFGPIPVPDSMLQSFTSLIDQSMLENAAPQQTGYQVKSIQVGDGFILITAVPKQP